MSGLAYLTRTAGIALFVSLPFCILLRKDRSSKQRAVAFLSAMVPMILGWTLWSRLVMHKGSDATVIYYTDYLRYQFMNVGLDNLTVVLWKNIDQLLSGIGSLILPKVMESLPLKILAQVIAVAAIAGIVRLVKKGIARDYAVFAVISCVILVVWHFPPNERFVLPLFPLIVAGFITELEHMTEMLRASFRHKDRSQRVAAALMSTVLVLFLGSALVLQLGMTFRFLDDTAEQKRVKLRDLRAAYTWIQEHLPADAPILSYDDPLMYLYTGHRGNYLTLAPRWWYAEDHASMVGAYRNLAEYCRSRGISYVYFTTDDPSREVGDDDRQEIAKAVQENPRLKPLFHAGIGTVYQVE